jgi:hypothetical protein
VITCFRKNWLQTNWSKIGKVRWIGNTTEGLLLLRKLWTSKYIIINMSQRRKNDRKQYPDKRHRYFVNSSSIRPYWQNSITDLSRIHIYESEFRDVHDGVCLQHQLTTRRRSRNKKIVNFFNINGNRTPKRTVDNP